MHTPLKIRTFDEKNCIIKENGQRTLAHLMKFRSKYVATYCDRRLKKREYPTLLITQVGTQSTYLYEGTYDTSYSIMPLRKIPGTNSMPLRKSVARVYLKNEEMHFSFFCALGQEGFFPSRLHFFSSLSGETV